jgi:hypothetical protein
LKDALKRVDEDARAFYLETIMAQPESASTCQLADWFRGETADGKLHSDLKASCLKSGDPSIKILALLLIVARGQNHRISSE